jgi:hypothetical protein
MLGLHAGCLQAAAEARLRVFPAQAANQPGLPSAAQPLRRRCVDQSASRRLRKHQHEGSMCEEKSQAELCQENCRAGSIRQTPYGTGQLPERRAHQDAARSAKALCPKKKDASCRAHAAESTKVAIAFCFLPSTAPAASGTPPATRASKVAKVLTTLGTDCKDAAE